MHTVFIKPEKRRHDLLYIGSIEHRNEGLNGVAVNDVVTKVI